MMKKIPFIFFLLLIFSEISFAQKSVKDSTISLFMLNGSFAYQIPGGDLADRFYANYNVGGSFQYKTKTNWLFGIDGYFLFRDDVKENNILKNIQTSDGNVISSAGLYADVFLYERGLHFMAKAGKLFPVMGPNKNSGIYFTLGGGYLEHKIKINTPGNDAPQLTDEYKKGYDRLTTGFALTQSIGYLNLSSRKLVNFFAALEITEGFTQNRRTYNFDTMMHDGTKRLDLLYGLRVGWVLPIYKRAPKEFYYN